MDEADVADVQADRVVYPARYAKLPRVNDLVARTGKTEPLFLVGRRPANALDADGTLRADVRNANGYLRRVTGVTTATNGDVVFTTRKASLTEAKDELARQGFMNANGDGCFPATVNPFTAFHVDLSRSLSTTRASARLAACRSR